MVYSSHVIHGLNFQDQCSQLNKDPKLKNSKMSSTKENGEIFVMDGAVRRNRGDKPGEDPTGKKKPFSYGVTEVNFKVNKKDTVVLTINQFLKDLSLWTRFNVPIFGEIRFNPIVSFTAIILIWSFVAICSVYQKEVPFAEWKGWLVEYFTWLYIGSQDIWAIFIVVLYFR